MEYQILKDDFNKGIYYKSFEEFWNIKIVPNTFMISDDSNLIPENIKENIKNDALIMYNKFKKDYPNA